MRRDDDPVGEAEETALRHGDDPSAASGARRLARHGALLAGAQVGSAAIGLATTLVISRALGPTALGRWSFAVAVAAYLLVVTDAGLSQLAIREIARDRARAHALGVPVLAVQAAVAGGLYALLVVAVLLSGLSRTASTVTIVVALAAFVHALGIGHVFQAFERMATVARYSLVTHAAGTAVGLVALVLTRQLVWLAAAQVAAGLVSNALLLRLARRSFDLPLALPAPAAGLRLLTAGAPFLVTAIATQLIFNADAILIQLIRGVHDLGLYAAGYALPSQLLLLTGPLMAAVYPRLSAEGAEGSAALTAAIAGALGFVVLPIALGGAAVSDQLVALLYGHGFRASGRILALAMTLPTLGAYNSVLLQALNARGRQHAVMRVALGTAAFNVALNLALLPLVGIVGAAIAVAAAELLTAVSFSVVARGSAAPAARAFGASALLAGAAAGAVLAARAAWSPPLALNVAVGAAVYLALAVAVRPAGARSVAAALSGRR